MLFDFGKFRVTVLYKNEYIVTVDWIVLPDGKVIAPGLNTEIGEWLYVSFLIPEKEFTKTILSARLAEIEEKYGKINTSR